MRQQMRVSGKPDVRGVKARLSEKEFSEQRTRIEDAIGNLEHVRNMLSSTLFLVNGRLSMGDIKYAAFRLETLSLIFELARDAFIRKAGGDKAYLEYLEDLGDEVGFTFARDIVRRLAQENELLNVETTLGLLELWASFENDTGAGEHHITGNGLTEVFVSIRNNPLRTIEGNPHAHCRFYQSYLKTLINVAFSSRARHLQEKLKDVRAQAAKVVSCLEEPDAHDNCVFVVKLAPEKLTESFDLLEQAILAFEREEYEACFANARSALTRAQNDKLSLDDKSAPKQLYKVYSEILEPRYFKMMDNAYQRASQPLHLERGQGKASRRNALKILSDLRRSIYEIETTEVSSEREGELVARARQQEIVSNLQRVLASTSSLDKNQQGEIRDDLEKLQRQGIDKQKVDNLTERLKQFGGKAWEVAQPLLTDLLATVIKKQTGL